MNSIYFLLTILFSILYHYHTLASKSNNFYPQEHSDNWAVIVSTSKYYFNYRHNSDALALYHKIKTLGIPDSNIILMLPEDIACTPKNVVPGSVYNFINGFTSKQQGLYNNNNYDKNHDQNNLYDETSIEIDYKGDDVTVENFLRVLTNRHHPTIARNKRLLSNENSNLFIYLSGHGGDQFLKFRDTEVLTSQDLAFAMQQLHVQKRFHQAFLIVETCQASTMVELITTPNVITSTSSIRGENSYSHGVDHDLGLSVVDKYTYYLHNFYSRTNGFSNVSMKELLNSFGYNELRSTHHTRTELYEYDENGQKIRDVSKLAALDFFGSTLSAIPTSFTTPMGYNWDLFSKYKLDMKIYDQMIENQNIDTVLYSAAHVQPTAKIDRSFQTNKIATHYTKIEQQIFKEHSALRSKDYTIPFVKFLHNILPFLYIISITLIAIPIYYSLFVSNTTYEQPDSNKID